ncbi:minor capsid protein [Sutcliffiella horikoshii]|uniref:minor capsid protein n=1 Tax=Sutcliffiella horikoshii TaxID=79883 RepID=UPI00384FEC20
MRILELITFIRERVESVYYPNSFPTTSRDDCVMVRLTSGFPTSQWTGKSQPSFQIQVRDARHKTGDCEAKAYEIHKALTNLREVTIGESSVVLIRSMNSVPVYIGNDDQERPIYSMNFDCVVRP